MKRNFKILSWNVNQHSELNQNYRDKRDDNSWIDQRLEFIAEQTPDMVLLQGISKVTLSQWVGGMKYVVFGSMDDFTIQNNIEHTNDWADRPGFYPPRDVSVDRAFSHSLINLTASRWRLSRYEFECPRNITDFSRYQRFLTHFPERLLVTHHTTHYDTPWPGVETWNVSVELGRCWGEEKLLMLETLCSHLSGPRLFGPILAGDLKTPYDENNDGSKSAPYVPYGDFGSHKERATTPQKPEWIRKRWRDVEEYLLGGCGGELTDAFRLKHGHELKDSSGAYREGMYSCKISGVEKRMDHLFVSSEFRVANCEYLDQPDLTDDHRPLVAELRAAN